MVNFPFYVFAVFEGTPRSLHSLSINGHADIGVVDEPTILRGPAKTRTISGLGRSVHIGVLDERATSGLVRSVALRTTNESPEDSYMSKIDYFRIICLPILCVGIVLACLYFKSFVHREPYRIQDFRIRSQKQVTIIELCEKLRTLGAFLMFAMLVVSICAIQFAASLHEAKVESHLGITMTQLESMVPNLHHNFARRNPVVKVLSTGDLGTTRFGLDLLRSNGNWRQLCRLDSDGDGLTNGEELGDPCCVWVQGRTAPYRVWNLSEPSEPSDRLLPPNSGGGSFYLQRALKELSPPSCEGAPDHEAWSKQALNQYYMIHPEDFGSEDALRWFKYPCLIVIISLLGHWIMFKGLLRDLFGLGPASSDTSTPDLSCWCRCLIYCGAYIWTDGIAGMVHLTFDFCPHTYPFIGHVAKGFQFHHRHPSAWTVVPLPVMISHSLPLLGVLSVALILVPPKRCFRAFWSLTMLLCVITVLTHRWVHVKPETNYLWFQFLQWTGILMSHEHHMLHHNDLLSQFSNLSGVTDGLLDYISAHWLPAWKYQHWLTVLLSYIAIIVCLGAKAKIVPASANTKLSSALKIPASVIS